MSTTVNDVPLAPPIQSLDPFLRPEIVIKSTGLSKSAFYKKKKDGVFPAWDTPYGPYAVGYFASTLSAALARIKDAALGPEEVLRPSRRPGPGRPRKNPKS